MTLAECQSIRGLEEVADEHSTFPDGQNGTAESLAFQPSTDDHIRLYFREGLLESMACYASFEYGGANLIGLLLKDAVALVGREPTQIGEEIELATGRQTTAEFDDMGLILWIQNAHVVSVSVDDGSE